MTIGQNRVFKIVMSERCFRFKPDALPSHAPQKPGVYEFVTFADGKPSVLYIGLALNGTVYQALQDHMAGNVKPTAADLFAHAKNIYFDYVAQADISSVSDLKDIAGALISQHRPKFNSDDTPCSGQYASVTLDEA